MSWTDLSTAIASNRPSQKEIEQVVDNLRRRAKARFYADENFPSKAVAILRSLGARVRTAREAGLVGYADEAQVAFAKRQRLALVTCDRDFLDERRFPLIHSPAIFVFDFGSGLEQEIRLAFRCLRCVMSMPQFFDKWWKYDARREGWTELTRHLDGTTSRTRYRLWFGRVQIWT